MDTQDFDVFTNPSQLGLSEGDFNAGNAECESSVFTYVMLTAQDVDIYMQQPRSSKRHFAFAFYSFDAPGLKDLPAHLGNWIVNLSVRPSVCLSVCLSIILSGFQTNLKFEW